MSVLQQNTRRRMMLGRDNDALFFLVIINVVVFVLINFVKILYQITNSDLAEYQQVLTWLSVSANAKSFITHPWTLFTYMFSQNAFWPLLSSMLWLWGFGYILQDLAGNKKIIPIYLYGGVAGAAAFVITNSLVPVLSANTIVLPALIGALPSVMAIAIATTTLAPQYKIFPFISGGIPIWVLTVVFALITLGTAGTPGFAMAMVASGAIGFLFSWQLKKGNDWSLWMINLVNWVDGLFNPEKKQRTALQQLHYKAQKQPYKKTPHLTQQRIDDLLDKINQKGYQSLSEEEKDFLNKASNEDL